MSKDFLKDPQRFKRATFSAWSLALIVVSWPNHLAERERAQSA
jgi:hypothetical protein